MISVFDMIENITGKGKNGGYQHPPFTAAASKAFYFRAVKFKLNYPKG